MSATDFLAIGIDVIFISLGILAIVDYLRHRNGTRRDIALMFGVLAIPFLLQLVDRIGSEDEISPVARMIGIIALILEPYLLLRLVRYLRSMPAYIMRLAEFCMLATLLTGVLAGPPVPLIGVLVSEAYLIGFNLYAMVGFARGVLQSTGVQQKRLRFAAAGSGLFALIFIVSVLANALSLKEDFVSLFVEGLAGACVITYYVGFVPPRWLRQTWQFNELHHFLDRHSSRLTIDRSITFDELSTAALRTVGGATAVVAECDLDGKHLKLEIRGKSPFRAENLDDGVDAIGKAWKEQKADVVQVSKQTGSEIHRWAQSFNAQALFIIPIKGALHPWGLLIIVLRNDPLFPQDDLDLLALLAEQSAIQLDHVALNEELQRKNQLLEEKFSQRTAELNAAEGNYRDLADSAPIGIFRATLKGEILYANEKLAHIIGFDSPQAMIDSGTVPHWQNPADRLAFIERLQREGEVASAEIEILKVNGEPFPILISARLRGDVLTGTMMDITERKQAEERFQLAIEAAPNAVIMVDRQGQIVLVNSQTEKYFGYDRSELLGQNIDRLVPAHFRSQHPNHRFDFFLQPQARAMGVGRDLYGLRKDGSEFPVEIGLSPIKTQQTSLVIATVVDITERKRAEQALQVYTAKLEQSNRDLQEFAYVASHDLQEPLRKVQAFSDRLATKYTDVFDETGRDYLKRMRDASQRMQVLINDLLSLSRVATRIEPFVELDLNKVAKDVISDLENQIERAEGRVEIGELPIIQADPTQMHQLFQNLIGNALKFHLQGRPPLIKISAKAEGQFCQISIADNGIGFDIQYLDRIFKPFQRLHSREEYDGSGMGLAICRRIVERHGGMITATSTQGTGATFTLILPIHKPKEKMDGKG